MNIGLIVIWLLLLILTNVLMFLLAGNLNAVFWIAFAFMLLAYLCVLFLQMTVWKGSKNMEQLFMKGSVIQISCIYLLIQSLVSVILAVLSAEIERPILPVIINVVIVVVFGILITAGLTGNEYIEKINSRQKNNHIEL